jgi:sulfur transfer complex TusBCD TusB component (DsrH family)
LLVSEISDEEGDILFKLSEVKDDVVLIENGILIVLLVLGNR